LDEVVSTAFSTVLKSALACQLVANARIAINTRNFIYLLQAKF
jgi:hypothetical protein